jgi:DNA-binding NtrC family response regulator
VASTNRDLSEEIRQDRFRRDLFHRIALGRIKLPPLRRQAAAIAPLAQKFLEEEAAERGRRFRMISRPAIQLLEQYRWPGNVRQLRNVIRHAVLLHDDLELKPEHLTHLMEREESGAPQAPPLVPGGFSLPEQGVNLPELQLELARMALERTGGNLSRAADLLGLTRSQMRTLAAKLPEE